MNKIEAILSDADGTLVDTVELIRRGQYEASRTYLSKYGLNTSEIPDYDTYTIALNQVVGGSARHTLENTLALIYANKPNLISGVDYDELHSLLNPTQDLLAAETVKPFSKLSETLREIGERGVKLAIFTSGTPHHVVRNFLSALPELGSFELVNGTVEDEQERLEKFKAIFKDHFGLSQFEIITCNDTKTHKPDPEGINLAMDILNVGPDKSLVLGDHKVDMQTGINAGITTRVGVTHGFDDRETLLLAGATDIIVSLPELLKLI